MIDVLLNDISYDEDVFSKALVKAGNIAENLVVIDADLARATQTGSFSELFPNRYYDVGIAEQNMMAVAAGMSASGKISIVGTFATFVTKRALDQINVSIAYPKLPVIICGIEAGLSSGRNGATHQAVDDLAIMRAMPHMSVIDPADSVEIEQALIAAVKLGTPVYMRVQRGSIPRIFDDTKYEFEIGKGVWLLKGDSIAVISTGLMTPRALRVAREMKKSNIHVSLIHMPTLKPIDKDLISEIADKHKCIITAENHSIIGGLYGAVCEHCSQHNPTYIYPVGINDSFGETGTNEYLDKKYGLDESALIEAIKKCIKKYQ